MQPNGQPRAMLARSLMLQLHRAGHIQLPAQRFCPPNNAARHRAPVVEPELPREVGTLAGSLAELGPLEIRQVDPELGAGAVVIDREEPGKGLRPKLGSLSPLTPYAGGNHRTRST